MDVCGDTGVAVGVVIGDTEMGDLSLCTAVVVLVVWNVVVRIVRIVMVIPTFFLIQLI